MVVCVVSRQWRPGPWQHSSMPVQRGTIGAVVYHIDRLHAVGRSQRVGLRSNWIAQTEVCLTRETTLFVFVFTLQFWHCWDTLCLVWRNLTWRSFVIRNVMCHFFRMTAAKLLLQWVCTIFRHKTPWHWMSPSSRCGHEAYALFLCSLFQAHLQILLPDLACEVQVTELDLHKSFHTTGNCLSGKQRTG